jgi:hypothetical protein
MAEQIGQRNGARGSVMSVFRHNVVNYQKSIILTITKHDITQNQIVIAFELE